MKCVIAVAAATVITGCSLLGTAVSRKDTNIPSTTPNYVKLEQEAVKLGWRADRRTGEPASMDDWDLKIYPTGGGKLFFSRNNETGKIWFNCDAGPLDDRKACIAAANRLFEPAFGARYSDQ